MLFAVPMVLLYYVGVFAGLLVVFRREGKRVPWKRVLSIVIPVIVALVVAVLIATTYLHLRFVPHWPFLIR
jgi:sec-independent protein translocase protein TatC